MPNQPIIEVQDLLWQVNGKTIVSLQHLAIASGQMIALIGPNGAGKSSLIKLMALLQKPTAGKIFFKGQHITAYPLSVKRQMATVFQEPLLLSGTVYGNVALGLKIRRIPRHIIRNKVTKWLKQLKIEHLADRNIGTLSGGEAQRVSLARAMVMDPEILFLDEPFSALDLPTRAALLQDFSDIIKNTGIATLLVTHHVSEIPLMANRVCVLDNGQIIQDDQPERVLNYPNNRVVARLVGIDNAFGATITEKTESDITVSLENGLTLVVPTTFAAGTGDNVTVFIRPDDISIVNEATPNIENNNIFNIQIDKIIPMDSQFKIISRDHPPVTLLVSRRSFFENHLELGKMIRIAIPGQKAHLVKESSSVDFTKRDKLQISKFDIETIKTP